MNKLSGRLQSALYEPNTIRVTLRFLGVGVILYMAVVLWFGWEVVISTFFALGFKKLFIGAVLASSSYLWRFWRWEYSLSCLGDTLPRYPHLAIYLSGLAFTATPGKSGETFRSALLLRHSVSISHSLATFLIDRASDVLGMCLLGALAACIVGQHHSWVWIFSFAVMVFLSCTFAHLLSHRWASHWWDFLSRYLKWFPIRGGQATLAAWANVWKLQRVLVFSVVSMLAYGTQALVFAWFCHVAGAGISTPDAILVFVQATLFGAATMLPGGLGAMEAALIFQLVERGVSDGLAVSLAISIRIVTLWVGMSLGALSLLFSTNANRKLQHSPPER